MADSYWRFGESRQQSNLPHVAAKRPRADYDVPGGHELPSYFTREDERAAHGAIRDTNSIGASYDHYLRGAQLSSYGGGDSARPLSGGLSGRPVDDPRTMGIGGPDPAMAAKGRSMGMGGGRPELPLPPDATNTLFVEGLPANYIFRPFVGYKEVRLVTKESKHSGGDPMVLCFVDFASPAHAATAMDALQDYVASPAMFDSSHSIFYGSLVVLVKVSLPPVRSHN
ncbi:RNA-binding (RRM/RBD/RNP motifs) family protein [Actinidia rufa]|uniref:RNA-binding (RRM/RBD/RNP motifs) family protein n=1 Tax=Actinidia rufa TaxID=165716 RepID=A0A7J0G6I6_9ERIC|nr:RNA-binding (RRM/RBD/RNP motifs) family protein [Actinidia rufa]